MRTCVVVPTLDEAGGIGRVVEQVRPFADEILIVDGGSSDDTVQICRGVPGVRVISVAAGKGVAIRAALTETNCEVIVYLDGDGSHDPRDIPALIAPIRTDTADVVVGSRIAGGSDEFEAGGAHRIRRAGLRLMTGAVNACFGCELTDVLNGFRAIRHEAVKALPLAAIGFEIELEVIARALGVGLRVAEIPSHEYVRGWGNSKLPTAAGVPMLYQLARYLREESSARGPSRNQFQEQTRDAMTHTSRPLVDAE